MNIVSNASLESIPFFWKCNLSQLGSGPITEKDLGQYFLCMCMLLENEHYLMKSYHFVLRNRSEPSIRNAFSPSNRKPVSISRHSIY